MTDRRVKFIGRFFKIQLPEGHPEYESYLGGGVIISYCIAADPYHPRCIIGDCGIAVDGIRFISVATNCADWIGEE